jgi:HEAT repeat protein
MHEALDALCRWPEAVRNEDRDEVRDLLIEVIESGEPEVMTRALRVLPLFGRGAASAEEAAARRLTWPDPRVRLAAVSALHALRPQSPSTAPLLVRALRHQEAEDDALTERVTGEVRRRVRSAAMRALRRIAPRDEEVAAAVVRFLQSPHPSLRQHAARALGRIALPTEVTVDALVERITMDDAGHVRAAAVAALGRMGADGSKAVSAMAASLSDVHTRKSGAWALNQLGEDALPAAPALVDAFDANERRRMVVAAALRRLGPDALADLRQGLHRDSRWHRIGCAETLAEMGPSASGAEQALRELLFDRRKDVREAGQEALEAVTNDGDQQLIEGDSDE